MIKAQISHLLMHNPIYEKTLGKDRKLNPDGKRHIGIHKMFIFQALVRML